MKKPIDLLGAGPTYQFAQVGGMVLVKVTPGKLSGCGVPSYVKMTDEQFSRFIEWRNGPRLIQDVLPDLSADERDVLLTGLGATDIVKVVEGV